jgi:3-methyl-2-oxobutanoate hydroxymethyltransferase
MARFVKQYAQLAEVIRSAAASYVDEVGRGTFPGPEHTFLDTSSPTAEPAPANGTS